MELLEALNTGLITLQSPTVTSPDSNFPMAGRLRQALYYEMKVLFSRALWFNTTEVLLYPEADARIKTPDSMVSIECCGSDADCPIIENRDGYIYNIDDSTPYFSEPLKCKLVTELDFSNIPEWPAKWVTWLATSKIYGARFGVEDGTYSQLLSYAREAQIMTEREHLRKKRFSSLNTGAARELLAITRT